MKIGDKKGNNIMKFYKIKRIEITSRGDILFVMRNGNAIYKDDDSFISIDNGERFIPLYDEFTDAIVGFVKK